MICRTFLFSTVATSIVEVSWLGMSKCAARVAASLGLRSTVGGVFGGVAWGCSVRSSFFAH